MLGIPLRYVLKHPLSATADLAADPFEVLTTIHEYIAEEREPRRPQCPYQHDTIGSNAFTSTSVSHGRVK